MNINWIDHLKDQQVYYQELEFYPYSCIIDNMGYLPPYKKIELKGETNLGPMILPFLPSDNPLGKKYKVLIRFEEIK